jgi:hypothetical protein
MISRSLKRSSTEEVAGVGVSVSEAMVVGSRRAVGVSDIPLRKGFYARTGPDEAAQRGRPRLGVFVDALFGNSLCGHHHYLIRIFGGGQPMRDDQGGSPDR